MKVPIRNGSSQETYVAALMLILYIALSRFNLELRIILRTQVVTGSVNNKAQSCLTSSIEVIQVAGLI